MRRREFITLVLGVAAWPTGRRDQPALRAGFCQRRVKAEPRSVGKASTVLR